MNAFAASVNAIFADPHMAEDAIWRAGGTGAGKPVRIIVRAPDRLVNFGEGRFVTDTIFLDVRVLEAPELQQGDSFEIAGKVFEVRSEPLRDGERLVFACEVRAL